MKQTTAERLAWNAAIRAAEKIVAEYSYGKKGDLMGEIRGLRKKK
jgi:hypothetical protein